MKITWTWESTRRHLLLGHRITVCGLTAPFIGPRQRAFPPGPGEGILGCKRCVAWVARHGFPRYTWDDPEA